MTEAQIDAMIDIERDGLAQLFEIVASSRETAPEAADDPRYAVAARSIRAIAATMHKVDDGLLVTIALVDQRSGSASKLIAERLFRLGFELPTCADAPEFFALFEAIKQEAYRQAYRQRLH